MDEVNKVQQLILGGMPARNAFHVLYPCYKTFQNKYPRDYRRLLLLAKGYKKAIKGETVREIAKTCGLSENNLKIVYPELWHLTKRVRRETDLSRVAYVAEVMVMAGDTSLSFVAEIAGESINTVYSAWNKYYGLEDKNMYGLKSKV